MLSHLPTRTLSILALAISTLYAAPLPSGLDLSGFDPAVRIQDNLYQAVNGGWLQRTEIPANKQAVFGDDPLVRTQARISTIVHELAQQKHIKRGSIGQQVGTFYAAWMNTDAIERAGMAPVKAALRSLDAVATLDALASWQGDMQGIVETPIFMQFVLPDFKQPTLQRVYTGQGGLGLPGRDYYLDESNPAFATARTAYLTYLTTLATRIGLAHPEATAQDVFALEKQIAALHVPIEDTRDPGKMYNPLSATGLAAQAPGFDWTRFLKSAGLNPSQPVVLTTPTTATGLGKLYQSVPLTTWKAYFSLRLLDGAVAVLPSDVRLASFAFHGTALSGMRAETPREAKAIDTLNNLLGEPLGRLYVERYFPAEDKTHVERMTQALLTVARQSIRQNSWMADSTRQHALAKLDKYQVKVGYPSRWRDYSHLNILPGDPLGNLHRTKRHEWLLQAAKAGQQVNREDWMMTPQTVDAYYDPMANAVNLPAGFLQAPIFDPAADDAYNYGALGTQIGHEISHGFDNLGNQFDGDGVFSDWWQASDKTTFAQLTAKLVAQFNQYEALPGARIDGQRTLPENLADLAGVQLAFAAYQASLGGKPSPVIDGYTGEQRFFLAYAQSKRSKLRPELQRQLLSTDVHAPQFWRANGAVINSDGFQSAFSLQPGDALFKPANERLRMW
ncbi:M13 family metallopeptidase [Burkholderiaceae bacterium DAT-1]|nr:M13 family metallopeptidase [Burkholderiaceae bacterium DAT-1]